MMKPFWVINLIVTNLQILIEKNRNDPLTKFTSTLEGRGGKWSQMTEVTWFLFSETIAVRELFNLSIYWLWTPGLNVWGATSHPESSITWSQVKQCSLLGNRLHGNWVFSGFSQVSRTWRVRLRVGKTEHATELPTRLWGLEWLFYF